MTALEQPPASVPDFAALKACRHPVAYAHELADAPIRRRLLGEDLVLWRDSGGTPHALRDLCIHRGTALSLGRVVGDRIMCPYHGWQYGGDGVCTLIPQLADPTQDPGQGEGRRVRLRGALRAAVGGDGGAALRAAGDPGVRGPRVDRRARRPVRLERRRRRASSRTSPTSGTSRGSIRACSATPSVPSCPDYSVRTEGHVLLLRHRPPRGAQQRRLPGLRQRDADRRARAPQPLPAAPAVHDPAAARVGRREGDGLLLQLPARRRGPLRRLRHDRPQLRPASSPTASCRTSRTRSSSRTATSSSPSGPSGCRSTSRPRCT